MPMQGHFGLAARFGLLAISMIAIISGCSAQPAAREPEENGIDAVARRYAEAKTESARLGILIDAMDRKVICAYMPLRNMERILGDTDEFTQRYELDGHQVCIWHLAVLSESEKAYRRNPTKAAGSSDWRPIGTGQVGEIPGWYLVFEHDGERLWNYRLSNAHSKSMCSP